jgi:murein DD-endopeptidase MepM/ murein hydrolase activator NlpD
MTADKSRSAAEEVLAILDADATLIDNFDATEIEALPIADVKTRLLDLGLSPIVPAAFRDAISSSMPAQASREVPQFLTEDAKEFRAIEKQPLAEVTGRLRKWGLNYEAGTNKIIDLVQRHARTNSMATKSRRYFVPTLWAASLAAALFAGGMLRTAMRIDDTSIPPVASLAPAATNFHAQERVTGSNQRIQETAMGGPPLPPISETPTTDAKRVRTIPITPEGDATASSTNALPPRPSPASGKRGRAVAAAPVTEHGRGADANASRTNVPPQHRTAAVAVAAPRVTTATTAQERPNTVSVAAVAAPTARVTSAEVDPTPSQPEAVAPDFRWPVHGRIVSSFGSNASGKPSDGVDIAVPKGTTVKAADDGVVAYAGNELKGYGNAILVRHPNGFVTAYAHADELLVRRGDTVKRGQVIARFATTDPASPQLHFEIRKGASPVDPTTYLTGQ